jgi:sugar O-acyltransferase (sialic acid O-acetyltransferase NeuD family)
VIAKKLVIFGSGVMAELSHYYFTNDSDYDVVGFTVDKDFIHENVCMGLPVVAFEDLPEHFSPESHELFIALSYSQLNRVRKERFIEAKKKGYSLASYISSHATVLNDGKIGDNCFVLEDNTIQPFVKIGHNVTLWSGNHIGHHSTIDDHTFIASHVVISGGVNIGKQCFIGVNATLRDHINIGDKCVVGAGALILKSIQDQSLVKGHGCAVSDISTSKLKKI